MADTLELRERLAANVAAGKAAAELVDLAGEQPPHFWECLAKLATAKLPAKEEPSILFGPKAAMNDAQAATFERSAMPFGKYEGEQIADVPARYLLWLTESEFTATMRRYLASDRFQYRLDQEGE